LPVSVSKEEDVPVRVVVADDHSLVRQGLCRSLEDVPDIEVVAEAGTGDEVLAAVERHKPDVALLDIRMPGMDGIEAAGRITRGFPDTSVVMLTAHADRHHVVEAVRAGARGYVLKTRDAEELVTIVRRVAAGGLAIDPELVAALAEEITESGRPGGGDGLTGRELEILRLLADGMTNRQIGARLFISPDTVKTHLEHVFQKLGIADRTSAVAEAIRRGLIE
jgi:DNA-binding NarL/FixJ family response regulator